MGIHTVYLKIYVLKSMKIHIFCLYVRFCDTYPCTACVDVYVQKSNVNDKLVPTSPKKIFSPCCIYVVKVRPILDTKQ